MLDAFTRRCTDLRMHHARAPIRAPILRKLAHLRGPPRSIFLLQENMALVQIAP